MLILAPVPKLSSSHVGSGRLILLRVRCLNAFESLSFIGKLCKPTIFLILSFYDPFNSDCKRVEEGPNLSF